jgi:hypothetical protein
MSRLIGRRFGRYFDKAAPQPLTGRIFSHHQTVDRPVGREIAGFAPWGLNLCSYPPFNEQLASPI